MKKSVFFTTSPGATRKLGSEMAKEKKKEGRSASGAVVLGLRGDLGGGKTTFLQGFAKGLGVKEKILSPTFVIFKKFKIKKSGFKEFFHFDCYRIDSPKEILSLGFEKIISDPKNIVAIEWPERIEKILPQNAIEINFIFLKKNKRKITLRGAF